MAKWVECQNTIMLGGMVMKCKTEYAKGGSCPACKGIDSKRSTKGVPSGYFISGKMVSGKARDK